MVGLDDGRELIAADDITGLEPAGGVEIVGEELEREDVLLVDAAAVLVLVTTPALELLV